MVQHSWHAVQVDGPQAKYRDNDEDNRDDDDDDDDDDGDDGDDDDAYCFENPGRR